MVFTDEWTSYQGVDEYSFRYNQRDSAQPMFWAILDRVRKNAEAT